MARQESMDSTCGGPMRQLGATGQVKVNYHLERSLSHTSENLALRLHLQLYS